MQPSSLMNDYREALDAAQGAPKNPTAQFNLGWYATRAGDTTAAIEAYRRALALGINQPEEAWLNLGSVYSEQLGAPEAAIDALKQAIAIEPDYVAAWFNLGHIAEQLGDREAARAHFGRVLELDPDHSAALARLADTADADRESAIITRLRTAAGQTDADADLLYALARQEESLGNYRDAWGLLEAANHRDRRDHPRLRDQQIQGWRDASRRLAGQVSLPPGSDEKAPPVFICGMFRTGSTLLEQMLAAHPNFSPLGESEFWPRRAAAARGAMVVPARLPDGEVLSRWREAHGRHVNERGIRTPRYTDKRPDNVYQLHLIGSALPDARFVITDRDWRDVVISVFGTRLHAQHHYATVPQQIREQLALVDDVASMWQSRYPERFFRLRYEDLVADPRQILSALLDWLGEAWSEECLDFHRLTNSVRTASVWQVREPLGPGRLERWRRFEEPLRQLFGASLDDERP